MSFCALRSFFLVCVILSLAASASSLAEEPLAILKFDTNGDGRINAAEATPEFLKYINRVFLPETVGDEDKTVEVLNEEKPADLPQKVVVEVADAMAAVANADGAQEEPVAALRSASLLLRRRVEEVSLTRNAKELDAADGAVVSYTNDVRQGTEEWQVQGALLYPIRFQRAGIKVPGPRALSAYTFVPSVSFDRKFHSADAASEIDSLVFRLGSEWEIVQGRFFPRQFFRFAPVYATDFELESTVIAGEFQYEVLRRDWGLGAMKPCLMGKFNCQWRAIMHLEGGKTLDAGGKVNLTDDEEFLRAGPKLNVTLQPDFERFNRLELKASYVYLEDLMNDGGATDLFESGISWRLDENGHLRLRAQYRHGDLPLTRDKITIVTTGLEVKF